MQIHVNLNIFCPIHSYLLNEWVATYTSHYRDLIRHQLPNVRSWSHHCIIHHCFKCLQCSPLRPPYYSELKQYSELNFVLKICILTIKFRKSTCVWILWCTAFTNLNDVERVCNTPKWSVHVSTVKSRESYIEQMDTILLLTKLIAITTPTQK